MALAREERLGLLAAMAAGGSAGANQWHQARQSQQAMDREALAGLAGDMSWLAGPGNAAPQQQYQQDTEAWRRDLALGQSDYTAVQGFDRTAGAGVMADTREGIGRNAMLHGLQRQIQEEQRRAQLLQRDQAAGTNGLLDLEQWQQKAIAQGVSSELQDADRQKFTGASAGGFAQEAGMRAVGDLADYLGQALRGTPAPQGTERTTPTTIAVGADPIGSAQRDRAVGFADRLADTSRNLRLGAAEPRQARRAANEAIQSMPLQQQEYGEQALLELGYDPLMARGLAGAFFPSSSDAVQDMRAQEEAANFLAYGNEEGQAGADRDLLSALGLEEDLAVRKAANTANLPESTITSLSSTLALPAQQVAGIVSSPAYTQTAADIEDELAQGTSWADVQSLVLDLVNAGELDQSTALALLNVYEGRGALNVSG
jgi:hypothetical protein